MAEKVSADFDTPGAQLTGFDSFGLPQIDRRVWPALPTPDDIALRTVERMFRQYLLTERRAQWPVLFKPVEQV
jgi:hypothetical protein